MSTTLPDRIRKRLAAVGKSPRGASLEAGLSERFIANIFDHKSVSPRAEGLAKIARVLKTTEVWLMREEGPEEVDVDTEPMRVPLGDEFPRDPDPDEPMTAGTETGRRGIPDDASALLDVTGGMGAGGVTIVSPGVPGKHGMTFAAEHVRDYWRIPGEVLASMHMHAGDVTVIQVQGDSMAGTLIEDDYVFVDTRHRLPSPGGIYALGDEFGGIIVKRLEVIGPEEDDLLVLVKSDNPQHNPKTRRLSEMRIIGRVVRRFGVVR